MPVCGLCNRLYDTIEEAQQCFEIHSQKLMIKMIQESKINVEELQKGYIEDDILKGD